VIGNLRRLLVVRMLYWTHFVAAVLVPFLTDWGGLTLLQVFILNAWFMLWNLVFEVPTGAVADRFGRKWSIAVGTVLTAAGCLTYVSTPSFVVFLGADILMALGNTLVSGADEALGYDSLVATGEEHRASRWLAHLQAAQLIGIVVGALGGGIIASRWGLRAPVALQTIPMVLAGVLATTLVEVEPRSGPRPVVAYRALLLSGVRWLRAERNVRIVAGDMVTVAALTWTLVWLYQPLLERAGIPRTAFGLVAALLCLVQAIVLHRLEWLIAVVGGRARYLHGSAVVAGLAMVALAPLTSPLPLLVTLVIAMGLGQTRMPVAAAAINATIGSAERATTLSTVSMLRTLSVCIVNPVAGLLADRSLGLAVGTLGLATVAVGVLSPLRERHLAS
jgi:MFS family permease